MRNGFKPIFSLRINVLSLLLIGFAALQGQAAQAPDNSPVPRGAQAPPAASVVSPDYRLGPGDVLQIYVWRNPELSVTIPVRPDGKISTPLVEDLVAVGKSASELARDIETALSEYVLSPKVNVIVTASTSSASQVKVIGQVRAPQALPYRAGMTALDAVIAVGGLTEFAAGNRARILRKSGDGQEQSLKVALADIVKGKLKYNVELMPGDVIVVPESLF